MHARACGRQKGRYTPQQAGERDEPSDAERTRDPDHEPDYYAVLGLRPNASAEEIRHAFRRLAKLWHPDRYISAPAELRASAERRMRALTRAYAVLGDALERHAYDRRRGMPGTAAVPSSESWMADARRSTIWKAPTGERNANGAGQFAGILCLILAFALLGRLLAGGLAAWEGALVTLLLLGLLVLASFFFTTETPLAAKARDWAEGEPAGRRGSEWREATEEHGASAEDDDLAAFETLVDEALAGIPDDFKSWLENVVVRVEDEPSAETLREARVEHGHTLLGLYVGVPLTAMGAERAGPEVVTIFRRPIEDLCDGDPDLIREQVRSTVLHELAHHFGIDHDEMPDWIK
jgi:predicted Zn-dependent protease with MMP-like domain/curved DNA-binding protein CbpA